MNSARKNYLINPFCGRIIATIAVLVGLTPVGIPALGQDSAVHLSESAISAERKATAKEAQAPEQNNISAPLAPNAANNYVFATTTGGTFTDMSSGTTQLVGPTADDAASPAINIGFDFFLLGVRYTQFSASSNGIIRLGGTPVSITQAILGSAGQTLIAAYGSDLATSGTGQVHFKVTGTAPNRLLTVEFLNETIILGGSGADGTYQVRLYETTGVVEFVYGPMNRNSTPLANSQWVGFSTSSADNTYVTVTTATNTPNTTGAPVSNQPAIGAPIANLNTPVDGSRRTYSFSPATPTAPTALNFTAVTQFAMTLNWTDSPDENLYAVYRSTDGVNYNFETTLAANVVSYPVAGLVPSTSYFWRVFAISDGAFSTALSGSQATTAPGSVASTAAGGNWSIPATWSGGVVPLLSDNVTIVNGATVTIDTAAVAYGVTVNSGGILEFEGGVTPRTLVAGGPVTVDSGGVLHSPAAGTVTTHVLSVGTDLTNNGTLDFSTNGNTAAAVLTFTGATNNTFSGTGATTDVRTIIVNKGTSNANTIELTSTNFTVQGVNTDVAGFLTLTNGTFKISGTFTMTNRVFPTAIYTIPLNGGIWLNNPNFTVVGQASSTTTVNNGLFRVSQGIYNIGVGAADAMGGGAGAVFNIDGGTVNASGRINPTTAVSYTQSGGTVNVGVVGNSLSGSGSFQLSSTTSSFTMSGGSINLVNASTGATPVDYRVLSSTVNVTGGTLNVGTGATAANFNFRIAGSTPNLVIDNTTNAKAVTCIAGTLIRGTTLVNPGTTLTFNGFLLSIFGPTFTNNGTVIGTTNNSRLYWQGSASQTYTGTGMVNPVVFSFEVDNPLGVTIDPSVANIGVRRIILFNGGVTNSNRLTLGNGDATVNTIQIGNTPTATAPGSFDVPLTFNLGTGGQTISYLRSATSRTTGNEVNPGRTLVSLTYNDDDPTHTLTIAGGDLTLTSAATALALTNGRVVTGANTLIVSSGGGGVTRSTGYVDGNLRRNYSVAVSKPFFVGTANGYSPVTVNATAGTFPADFTVRATQGPQPSVNPATSIQRYWTLTETGDITANLTFIYLDLDVVGNEANYRLIRVASGPPVSFPASVNPGTNTAILAGVSNFSDWTVGEVVAPTAAPATISGQVTATSGAPIPGVTMYLSGAKSARTITDGSGNYRFVDVETENFYTVTPSIVNHQFSPANLSFSLLANKTDAVFTGSRNTASSLNVIDTPEYFVRQHYLDFLGREPDDSGLNFWSDQILGCGEDFNCTERRTINVSAAYFLSIEFQQTGGLVDGLYRASYGRAPLFDEFMPDARTIGDDLIVGQPGWEQVLETNKQEFLDAWVERAAFRAAYDNLANDGYVDALISNTGVTFTPEEREVLLDGLNNSTLTRAAVLQRVAQNERFVKAKFNEAFVRMQYFGYLRRDPDDSGFHFWLDKLNEFDGNFEQAEMVKAFLVSGEYRQRFR